MIKNPEVRHKMGQAGRVFVSERFNPVTTTKHWIELYTKI
jgi:hypothetical protein